METQVAELILKHGLPAVIMALIVMILVGIVKIFTKGVVNRKQVSENKKKWLARLYLLISGVLSVGVVMLYYALILKADAWSWAAAKDALLVFTLTPSLYQLYKQFGGRKLLVTIVSALQKLFKGKDARVEKILNVVMQVLDSDVPLLTEAQKEAIQIDLKSQLGGKAKVEEEAK